MSSQLALAQLVLYALGAALLYRVAFRMVERRRISAFAASAWYWAVLATAPSLLVRAAGSVGNYIYVNRIVMPEAAWDVGLAMWLYVGMWACHFSGYFGASFASWRFFQQARRSTGTSAT